MHTPRVREVHSEPLRRTVAVDFDGVIHGYSRGWQGGELYDVPTAGAAEALHELSKHYKLVVFTARHDVDAVWAYLRSHRLAQYFVDVTNRKPAAVAYIDDRAVRFHDWGQVLEDLRSI